MLPLDLLGIAVTETKAERPLFAMARSFCLGADYETIKVPERRQVTWGVDIGKLGDWLEEVLTVQMRLPNVG